MLIKVAIIILCVYFLMRWIAPTVLRYVVRRMFRKMADKGARGYQYDYKFGGNGQKRRGHSRTRSSGGNVNIDYVPKKRKQVISDEEGEYVDYEEIK